MQIANVCIVTLLFLATSFPAHAQQLQAERPFSKLTVGGKDYYGMPLGFDGKKFAVMDPTGKFIFIPVQSTSDLKIKPNQYRSNTPEQIRQLLENEFGARYDIATSQRYVVVHPWGVPSSYLQPFETLHQRFVNFVESHGVELSEPKVPLVAAVLRSRNDFDRYLLNEVQIKDSNIAGYYSSRTNRITTFDSSGYLRPENDQWIFSAGPIIHEAVHQSAFNTGLHNRFAPPPKWMSEGLSTLFEVRGFSDPEQFPRRNHRINPKRLKHLRKKLAGKDLYTLVVNLVDNDRMFETDIATAYALSWGLSFYLYETSPEQYFQFLAADAKRKNFSVYTGTQRLEKFAQAFGSDFEALAEKLKIYFQ